MLSKTLYITDLDGTLLNPEADLSDMTVEIINDLIDGGLAFTYATARSFSSSSKKTMRLNLKLPVITNNGTFILDAKNGKPIFYRTLDKGGLNKVYKIIKSQEICVMVYALFDGVEKVSWVTGMETRGIRNYLDSRKGDMRFRPLSDYEALFDGDVFYLAFIDGFNQMNDLREQLADIPSCTVIMQEDVYTSGEYWLEIFSGEVSKGDGAIRIKEMLGYDKIVCFGDNLNDVPLFEVSDERYAVDNAVDELKRIASGIIKSNAGDGVALWLLENCTKGAVSL